MSLNIVTDEDDGELIDHGAARSDGTPYTQGQPRGPEPEQDVDLLQEEDKEPFTRSAVEADEYDAESILMAKDPDEGSKRGHPVYGAASQTPGQIDESDLHTLDTDADGDEDGDGERETEDDELAEIEAALASEESGLQKGAPTSQPAATEAVSATGKAHGTSVGAVSDPEQPEPVEPDARKGGAAVDPK